METLILFLLVAAIVYFVAGFIAFLLAQLHPPKPAPSWLMPILALVTATALVYLSPSTLPQLPFPSDWSQVWRVFVLALAGLFVALFTRLLEHATAEGR